MEIAEFERCINLGLGRAILHLQKHSSEPYRDAILYACLHNTVYDAQFENSRGEYIRKIIRLTGDEHFYQQRIFKTLKNKLNHRKKRLTAKKSLPDNHDIFHLLDNVVCFAKEGDKEAKDLIYSVFDRTIKTRDVWGASDIIEIDSFDGLVYVAEKIIENRQERWDDFRRDFWRWNLEQRFGEEFVQTRLAELRQSNPKFDTYLKVVESYSLRQELKRRSASAENPLSYAELKRSLRNQGTIRLWHWGEKADNESLVSGAIDMEQETDPELLKKYLEIFYRKTYPISPEALFRLTKHEDSQIAAMSFKILEKIQNPSVREFALSLIAKEENIGRAIGLLENNFEEVDWALIKAATEKTLEPLENHYLQMKVRNIAEAHPSPKAIKSLLNLYEYGVCSFCRRYILEALMTLDALPESIREECFHDSNNDIREWAKKGFPLERG